MMILCFVEWAFVLRQTDTGSILRKEWNYFWNSLKTHFTSYHHHCIAFATRSEADVKQVTKDRLSFSCKKVYLSLSCFFFALVVLVRYFCLPNDKSGEWNEKCCCTSIYSAKQQKGTHNIFFRLLCVSCVHFKYSTHNQPSQHVLASS